MSEMPRCWAARGFHRRWSSTLSPATTSWPPLGCSAPAIMLMSTDLPAPFLPMTP